MSFPSGRGSCIKEVEIFWKADNWELHFKTCKEFQCPFGVISQEGHIKQFPLAKEKAGCVFGKPGWGILISVLGEASWGPPEKSEPITSHSKQEQHSYLATLSAPPFWKYLTNYLITKKTRVRTTLIPNGKFKGVHHYLFKGKFWWIHRRTTWRPERRVGKSTAGVRRAPVLQGIISS